MEINFEITGQVPSKKNSYRKGKYGNLYKPDKITDWEAGVSKQLMVLRLPRMAGKFEVSYLFFTRSDKQDLDNMITSVNDILQTNGIIDNDRHIVRYRDCEKIVNKKVPYKTLIIIKLLET